MGKVEVRKCQSNTLTVLVVFFIGCAFITFQKRQCAVNAIKSMHQSQTMEVEEVHRRNFEENQRILFRVVHLHWLLNLPIHQKIKKARKYNNNIPIIPIYSCHR